MINWVGKKDSLPRNRRFNSVMGFYYYFIFLNIFHLPSVQLLLYSGADSAGWRVIVGLQHLASPAMRRQFWRQSSRNSIPVKRPLWGPTWSFYDRVMLTLWRRLFIGRHRKRKAARFIPADSRPITAPPGGRFLSRSPVIIMIDCEVGFFLPVMERLWLWWKGKLWSAEESSGTIRVRYQISVDIFTFHREAL